jgi:hypothetical protein
MNTVLATVAVLLTTFMFYTGCNRNDSGGSSSPATPSNTGTALSAGLWGGDHIQMMITDSGATFQTDCGSGTIDQRLAVDAAGAFHATGTLTLTNTPSATPTPATFDGTIREVDHMSLKVTTTVNNNPSTTTYRLEKGEDGRLSRCQ